MINKHECKLGGFTLAEVLITLGIIGVVAAMTLPTVINNVRNKQLETAFKKSYTILSQVMVQLNHEAGVYLDETQYQSTRIFKKVMLEKFGAISCLETDRKHNMNCFDTENENPYKDYSGKNKAWSSWYDDGQFVTPDGMTFMLQNSNMTVPGSNWPLLVSVDVNGYNKNPNKWGHDMFTFQLTKGKLIPMGAHDSFYPFDKYPNYCNSKRGEIRNGLSCTIRAITERDYFKNLPK